MTPDHRAISNEIALCFGNVKYMEVFDLMVCLNRVGILERMKESNTTILIICRYKYLGMTFYGGVIILRGYTYQI